jgi:type IV pilus modification protein PilV
MMNNKQRGLSLIELSVVLLLISISLTGVVSTMLKSQQLTRQSIQELDILYLVASLASKMQLNKVQGQSKNSPYLITLDPHSLLPSSCSGLEHCAQQQQALHHLNTFQQSLARVSVEYAVIICHDQSYYDGVFQGDDGCDDQLDSPLVVKVWWRNRENTNNLVGFYALNTTL